MAFIEAEDVIKTELIYDWDGQIVENLLWFLNDGAVDESAIDTLLDELEGWFTDSLAPALSNEIALTLLRGTDMTAPGSFVVEHVPAAPIPGENTDPSVPNNTALVLKLTTSGSGRSARGRNYIPGLPDTSTVGSTEINPITLAGLISAYEDMLDTPFTPFYELSVVSFYTLGAPRAAGLVQPVIGIGGDVFLDSQRRRLAGRGQ